MFRNIPTVQSMDENGFDLFPPILTTFSRCENILLHLATVRLDIKLDLLSLHPLVYQLDG